MNTSVASEFIEAMKEPVTICCGTCHKEIETITLKEYVQREGDIKSLLNIPICADCERAQLKRRLTWQP